MSLEELSSWRILRISDIDNILQQSLLLIRGTNNDDRCNYYQNKLSSDSKTIKIHYDVETTKLSIFYEEFEAWPSQDEDAVRNAEILAEFILENKHKILIDMTSLSTESLFILLKAFYELSYDDFTIVYVQPQEYTRSSSESIIPDYRLSDGISTVSAIPGFLRISNSDKPTSLLAFLGFEGGRFKELCEHLSSDGMAEVVPIMPVPSFSAGWHMLSLYLNLEALKTFDALDSIKRVVAWDPFHALAILERQYDKLSENNQIVVSPLGTKPHTLASVIFAINHEDIKILYDHPRVSSNRTSGVGEVWAYNMKNIFQLNNN